MLKIVNIVFNIIYMIEIKLQQEIIWDQIQLHIMKKIIYYHVHFVIKDIYLIF